MIRMSRKLTLSAAVATALTALTVGVAPALAQEKPPPPDSTSQAQPNLSPDRPARAGGNASPDASSALAIIQARIATLVDEPDNTYTFGSYVDPAGEIVVDTDAPTSVVAALTAMPASASASERRAASQAQVRRATVNDAFGRRDDVPPFYGGGGLSASGSLCSSGYAVRTSSGSTFMVTAGHCFANGTTVRTESGARVYGVVSNRLLASLGGGARDMELMSGQSYAGRVFTGGVTSSTSIPVISAGSAFVNSSYCHSGRTTGEQCGHILQSTTAQACTSTGCKSPVYSYTGGVISQGGDSGGTFYFKNSQGAYIRGHVIAGGGGTGYAETYNKVAAAYGTTVVTG